MNSLSTNRPVLIVDDSPMYRSAAKGMLQKLGYQPHLLHFAQDAKEAVRQCKANSYELIFFDYNLGEHANGLQLIEELKRVELISLDCVIIIVTGDATPEVVRGFMELEPDGYLLKPLNYMTLKDRLPTFTRKKRMLEQILASFSKKAFEDTIRLIDESFFHEEDIALRAQTIKAESLIALQKYDEAKNVLIPLNEGYENSKVKLLLTQLYISQRQFQQALFILEPLFTDPFHAAAALHKAAECNLFINKLHEAKELIEKAVSISPKNIDRHWLSTYINIASLEYGESLSNIKRMINESKNSSRETIEMYQLGACLTLDLTQFSKEANKKTQLGALSTWIESWRANFSRTDYKPVELLVLSRAYLLTGDQRKSQQMLSDYRELVSSIEDHRASLLEMIELSRIQLLSGNVTEYKDLSEKINRKLKHGPLETTNLLMMQYLSKWRAKTQHSRSQAVELKKRAIQLLGQKNYEKAVTILANYQEYSIYDNELTLLLYTNLSKAWPNNWSKKDVIHLAIRCHDQMKGTEFEQRKEFLNSSRTLSNQLGYMDLTIKRASAA
ncbi:response regulator [Vibrio rotiferianus]|uniref:response regulator n=1 Tax=Vibrio rotiferianus TaxID=190895 RepID=UPI00406A7C51